MLSLGVDVNSDLLYSLVEDGIGFHLLFDLLERVEHGRMVALAELAADIGRRQIRHAAHEVHRGLTGVDGLAASRRTLDDLFVDAKVARRFGDDHRRRGGEIRVLFHKVLDPAGRGGRGPSRSAASTAERAFFLPASSAGTAAPTLARKSGTRPQNTAGSSGNATANSRVSTNAKRRIWTRKPLKRGS